MSRRQAAWTIVVVWVAAFGWLVRREFFRPHRAAMAEGALLVSPTTQYFEVRTGDRQVGFESRTVDTLPAEIHVEDVLVTEQPIGGRLRHTEIRSFARLSRLLQLISFSARTRTDDGFAFVMGEVDGDSVLRLRIAERDSIRFLRMPLTRPLLLSTLIPLRLVFGRELAIGKQYDMQVFDPARLETLDLSLTVAADSTFFVADSARRDTVARRWVPARTDTVHAWRVTMQAGAASGFLWIDDQGQIVRARVPEGFTVEREAFELAFENFRKRDSSAELRLRPVIVPATIDEAELRSTGPALRTLTLRWAGEIPRGLTPAGAGQTLASDTVRVRRVTDLAADYALPASAARGGANLTPTLLIESADPRVRAVAVQETGGTPDPARAAELLAKAVHDRTTRRPEQGPPNARHTLESRRGDVNHLAELYVALARSIGLPARTASGLLYVNGRFYVHAWAEVLLKDWVPVDPALGQFPADAAHIRLATDRLARPMELTPQLGGVTITVLGTESER